MRFAVTVLLSMAAVLFLFPQIPGLSFAGGPIAALLLSLLTAGTAVFMKAIGRALTLTLRMRTAIHASSVLLPIWLLGIWLLPAFELKLFSGIFPELLASQNWFALLAAAGVLCSISAATTSWSQVLKKPCECD